MPDYKKISESEKKKLADVLLEIRREESHLDLLKKKHDEFETRMKRKIPVDFTFDGIFFRDKENAIIGHLKIENELVSFNGSYHKSAKLLFDALQKNCKEVFLKHAKDSYKKVKEKFGKDYDELKDNFESANNEIERLNGLLEGKTESAKLFAEAKEELEIALKEAESRMNELETELIKEREANQKAIEEISKLETEIISIQKVRIEDNPEYKRMQQEILELKKKLKKK